MERSGRQHEQESHEGSPPEARSRRHSDLVVGQKTAFWEIAPDRSRSPTGRDGGTLATWCVVRNCGRQHAVRGLAGLGCWRRFLIALAGISFARTGASGGTSDSVSPDGTVRPTGGLFARCHDIRSVAGSGLSASCRIEPCVRRYEASLLCLPAAPLARWRLLPTPEHRERPDPSPARSGRA